MEDIQYLAKNDEVVTIQFPDICNWDWDDLYGDIFAFETCGIKAKMLQCMDASIEKMFGSSKIAQQTIAGNIEQIFDLIKKDGYRLVSFKIHDNCSYAPDFRYEIHDEIDSLSVISLHGESTFNTDNSLATIYKASKDYEDFINKVDGLKNLTFLNKNGEIGHYWVSSTNPSDEIYWGPEWAIDGENGNYLLVAPESIESLKKMFDEIDMELKKEYCEVILFCDGFDRGDGMDTACTVEISTTLKDIFEDLDISKDFYPKNEELLEMDKYGLYQEFEKNDYEVLGAKIKKGIKK